MEHKKEFLIQIAYYGCLAAFVYLAVRYLLPVLYPFVFAGIFAALLLKPARFLAKYLPVTERVAALVLTALFYLILAGVIVFGLTRLIPAAGDFFLRLPDLYQSDILPFLQNVTDRLEGIFGGADPDSVSRVEILAGNFMENMQQTVSTVSVTVISYISGLATKIPGIVVRVVITIVATFFIAADYENILRFLKGLIPEKQWRFCKNIKFHGVKMAKTYLRSYSLLMAMTFAELLIGFLILRIPYAAWIALAIAVFDILPVLGTGGILLPWAAVMWLTGDYPLAAGLLILYIVITVIRNMAEPKIVGKQIGLPALATLIAMFAGGSLCGLIGLFLFPMALSVFVSMKKEKQSDRKGYGTD